MVKMLRILYDKARYLAIDIIFNLAWILYFT